MEVSSKKITSPLFAIFFISSIFIQCLPYVSSAGVNYGTLDNYPPSLSQPPPHSQRQPQPKGSTILAQPSPKKPYVPVVKNFCMPKGEATDVQLQANLDWICTNQGVDCGPIHVGGPCFKPNTVRAHAGWAMNAYYHLKGRNPWNCDFRGTGTIVHVDQSNGDCKYASNHDTLGNYPPSLSQPPPHTQPKPQAQPQPQPKPHSQLTPQPQPRGPTIPAQPGPKKPYVPEVKNFCMPKGEATDAQLQANLDWVCTNQGVDCGPIHDGGPCFKPNTVRAHAGWAMNAYYHFKGRNPWNCDFRGTGTIVHVDQSNGDCQYAF